MCNTAHVFEHESKRIAVSASFGVAAFDHELENDTLEAVLKRADVNLYKAKAEGRNRVA